MAVHDQSYAPWEGTYVSRFSRVRAIVEAELAQPFKNIWTLIVVILAFVVAAAWVLFLFWASTQAGHILQLLTQPESKVAALPQLQKLRFALGNNIYREQFFNNFLFSMVLTVLSATVGASLISRDLKHNALLMFFSKAITRGDYVAAKFLTLVLFLLFVTLGPALLLFLGQLGIGLEKITFGQRLADAGSILLHALILVVPTSAVVLACSAATKRAYLAGVLWATLFFSVEGLSRNLTATVGEEWCKFLSWRNLMQHLGDQVYQSRPLGPRLMSGPEQPLLEAGWVGPLLILVSITVASLAFVRWRVRSVEAGE